MADFPSLIPSEAPITPGAWPSTAHTSLNGAESRIRHGSAEIGRQWRPSFVNITEADFLAILNHYRGQRSGFDSFGFSTTTLAADLTPAGFAWVHASRPQVVDQHVNCFTVQCEFKCEPRALAIATGKTWRSVTTFIANANPGVQWLTSETTFLPGKGVRKADGVQWVTDATTFVWVGIVKAKTWVTSSTTLTKGLTDNGGASNSYTFTGGSTTTFTELTGWIFTVSSSKVIKGVGFYDHQQNGLTAEGYHIYLEQLVNPANLAAGSTILNFDAAGLRDYIDVTSSSTLNGVWRRVDLTTTGATLTTGKSYILFAEKFGSTADLMIKNATTVNIAANVNYVKNFDSYASGSTTSADGIGYFGPMIFFV